MRQARIPAFLAALLAAGCGGSSEEISFLTIESGSAGPDDILAIRDEGILIKMNAWDAGISPVKIDRSKIVWEVRDPDVLRVEPSEGTWALVVGLRDWFDTVPAGAASESGREPRTEITARYGDLFVTMPITVVLKASGEWTVTLDGAASQKLRLTQVGRNVKHLLTGSSGIVNGITFTFSDRGYTLTGSFASRDEAAGTYVGPEGETGTWRAKR